MAEILRQHPRVNIKRYQTIKDLLSKEIALSKLPVIGEGEIKKMSAERYGQVIIKLELETDTDVIGKTYMGTYSYAWAVDENSYVEKNGYLPLYQEYEQKIRDEITYFATLLGFLNENKTLLRFSVIGGSSKLIERPAHEMATAEALIAIFKKLNS